MDRTPSGSSAREQHPLFLRRAELLELEKLGLARQCVRCRGVGLVFRRMGTRDKLAYPDAEVWLPTGSDARIAQQLLLFAERVYPEDQPGVAVVGDGRRYSRCARCEGDGYVETGGGA